MTKNIVLGKSQTSKAKITLSPDARWLGNYIIGIQGMGKSNLLKQIALTDIANREGVCVISPHPDLTHDILVRIPEERWDDVILCRSCKLCLGCVFWRFIPELHIN